MVLDAVAAIGFAPRSALTKIQDPHNIVDKAPRLSISIVICILSSDTETSAATPLEGGENKVLAK